MVYGLLLSHSPTLIKPPYFDSPLSVPGRQLPCAGLTTQPISSIRRADSAWSMLGWSNRQAGWKSFDTQNPGNKKISGGVDGPCKCSDDDHHPENHESLLKKQQRRPSITSLFNFRHMTALALMLLLSASGLVSVADFAFVVFSFIYMYFLSKFAFPSQYTQPPPPVFSQNTNKIIVVYSLFAAVIGLFLPIAYMIWGVRVGDKEGVTAAASHLFLLSSQLFMEGVAFYGGFSLPVFVFVLVFNNSRRIFTLVDWLRSEFYRADLGYRVCVGRGLAMANMAFWCFNLFGFLLPVFLPRAFQVHFSTLMPKAE